ncbi:MAG: TIGR02186 family protein, partial [Fimbriimonadaceae bacterium]|nr:TIGR02186 family protein [Alphaproteobacteria bacterium]
LDDITTLITREQYQLGLDQLVLYGPGENKKANSTQPIKFDEALIRLMRDRNLYVENGSGLQFLSDALFSARITVPAHVPVGKFQAEVFLFGDGALLQRQTIALDVHKSGFEQMAYTLATQQSLLYGLLAVAMAVFAGWLASVIFRKD